MAYLIFFVMTATMSLLPVISAATDLPIFGPKRYERAQGKPWVFTDTFNGCANSAGQALIRVQNGANKDSSLSSALITLNGTNVLVELDFKNQTAVLERTVTLRPGNNTLSVQLKSGGQKETPFLIVQISGQSCGSSDTIPPVISAIQPPDGALLNVLRPVISASYADNAGGSGIDTSSVRVTLDGNDITSSCTISGTAVTCTPAGSLAEGGHNVILAVSDLAKNPASLSWRFTTDTIAPRVAITSPESNQYLGARSVTVSGSIDDPTAVVTVNGKAATINGATFSVAEVPLVEGSNNLTVVAVDPANNRAESGIKVIVDTTLPQVTITAPIDGSFTSSKTISVSGTVSEPPVSVLVNGRSATITGKDFTLADFLLAEGLNTLTVEATDPVNHKGTAIVTVNLDTVNPTIDISSPRDGLLTRSPLLTVSGKVGESVTSFTINGSAVTVSPDLSFSTSITLVEGVNTIVLEAKDRAGNKGSASITATLDSTAPTAPKLEGLITPTNLSPVTVSGSAEPASNVSLYNGADRVATIVTPTDGRFSFPEMVLHEGENRFSATALDLAGNESPPSAPVSVVLDTKAPVVGITAPLDKAILNTPAIKVSGTIDDSTAAVTVNGLAALNSGGTWTLENFTLQEGSNTLLAEAKDPAGNKGSVIVAVTLDTILPTVTITTPVDGLYTNIPAQTVSGSVSEALASLTLNGAAVAVSADLTYTSTLTLAEGANSIAVEATDLAGNKGRSSITVNLDTVAPQYTVIGPADGALLKNGQIVFGAGTGEPALSVTVNGASAPLGTGTSGYTLPITLTEGTNNLTVIATDKAGNSTTTTYTVTLDSIAPLAPTLTQQKSPTNTAVVTISGTAEAKSTVKISAAGALIGTVTADAQGNFNLPNVTLAEGSNSYTATATDAAGNESPVSAPLTIVLDTVKPVITVTAPQAGVVLNSADVLVKGTVNEPLTSLTINGGSTPLTGLAFEQSMVLAAGDNSALITATDLAGNVATTTLIIKRDSTPPVVTITTPLSGLLTKSGTVQVSGTVDDAEATLTVNGAAVANSNKSFSLTYTLSSGDNNIIVEATDVAGNKGSAATTVTLDAIQPTLAITAPPEAVAGANVTINLTAGDNRGLALVELKADGVPIWSGGNTPSVSEAVSYHLSAALNAGAVVTLQARGTDAAGNEGTATATISITQAAMGPGYIQGKALEDNRGLKLEGATVAITDAKGVARELTTAADGGYFLETTSGSALVKVAKPGFTSVERSVPVIPEKNITVQDARLTKIDGTRNLIDATGGTAKGSPLIIHNSSFIIEVAVPAGALASSSDLRLTPISNQGLAGLLPSGWSPLAAIDIKTLDPTAGAVLETTLAAAATVKLPLPSGVTIDPAAPPLLAVYDPASHSWKARGSATVAADGLSATAEITTNGQYALVLADPAPNGPAAAQAGSPLAAAAAITLDFATVTTAGKVVPQASPPSTGLKAAGEVVLTAKEGAAPTFTSGLVLSGRVTENFDLKSGDKIESQVYSQDIVLYRTPCATNIGSGAVTPLAVIGAELRTTFPVSPSKDYTIVDLLLGKVAIEIVKPDTSANGVMVGPDGGRLVDGDGNILAIPQGALALTTPVSTKTAAAATGIVGSDFTLIRAVEVNLTRQTLAIPATISIPAGDGFNPSLQVIVAKQIDVKGVARLKLVSLARQSGSFISSEPLATQLSNSSIATSGIYYFLQAKGQLGFVTGTVTDSGSAPFTGALVKTDTGSLVDLSAATGKYLVAAPVAPFTATAMDLYKGDEVSGNGAITAANQAVVVDLKILLIPPTIASVSPANGAINVQPTVPVVVTFSKPMDQATISSTTLKLNDSAGTTVPGSLTFSIDNRTVTFYPSDAFKQETAYSVTVAAAVKDLQGYPLGQDTVSSFTVRKTTPPAMPPAGSITGTFPDSDGFITVTATQGSAEPGNTVLLINDTTGEIQSVTPQTNGSFTGKVRGQLGDEIKVVLMDHSGNQTTVSYLTFKNTDGSYLVTAKGGKVEGEGGSLLDIPEGALVGPAVIKVTAVQEANLPSPVQTPGKYLGAVNIDTGGIAFQKAVEVSIPIPVGFNVNDAVFITSPTTLQNADDTTEQVYEIIDSTKIVGNRITSACDPFPGVFGSTLVFTDFPDLTPIIVSGYTYQNMNDQPSYQAPPDGLVETPVKDTVTGELKYNFDRPIARAVIRSPDSWNFISYTNSKGFYGTFASMAVLPAGFAGPDANCKRYRLTAINPLTMFRTNFDGYACAPPYNVRNVNFKLGEKGTIPPDRTAPVIDMKLQVVAALTDANRIVAGTTIVGTKLKLPITIIDQAMKSATLTVKFKEPGAQTTTDTPVVLTTPENPPVHAFLKEEQANLYRYVYTAQFNPDAGSNYYTLTQPGYYSFLVEAEDAAGNKNSRTLELHVLASGASLGTPIDGAPRVDAIFPEDKGEDIMVTTQITATFSEPVQNVENSFWLYDMTDPVSPVPATVITSIEGGRMQAILIPKGNLYYARKYKVVLTTGIKDTAVNPSAPNQPPAGDGLMNMEKEFVSYFTTKVPKAYDLDTAQQFNGGRDIDLYTFEDTAGETDTYAYVMAGDKGWKIIDVTDPTEPGVVFTASSTCTGSADPSCRYVNPEFSYRSVAVHPDRNRKLMAMTENIVYPDGNQYGYVRFYDLSEDPGNPPIIGMERLSEAFSGIPGKITLYGDYAVINNSGTGIQIVNIKSAMKRKTGELKEYGEAITGALDTMAPQADYPNGFGSPNDLAIFNERSAVVTTNPGYLLTVDLNLPTDQESIDSNAPTLPVIITPFKPDGYSFTRVGVAQGYPYTDATGMEKTINLAVAGTMQGKIVTIDLTDPTAPNILNPENIPVSTSVRDILVSKDAGLAFVTTYNAIEVYDIKDPTKPKLLNKITSLPDSDGATNPDGTPVMIPIGETPAIVENGGWVYLANMTKGIRTLDLDPVEVQLYCEDAEFPNVSKKFCTDYYPALGEKEVILLAYDQSNHLVKDAENATIHVLTGTDSTYISSKGSNTKIASVRGGVARFYINAPATENTVLKFKFKIIRANGVESKPEDYSFSVRHNGNVRLAEVLDGSALYTFDKKSSHAGSFESVAKIDPTKRVYFLQELLNQVVTRKRGLDDPFNPGTKYNYSLLNEDGVFNEDTYNQLIALKYNFKVSANFNVGSYTPSSTSPYSNNFAVDDTSQIFRKLMKDYGKRQSGPMWLVGGTHYDTSDSWLHKVVDRDTLVGKEFRVSDNLPNNLANNTAKDSGLYELYKNVVVKFVDGILDEAERYAGTKGDPFSLPNLNWIARNGAGPDKHGVGMSYSYGGSDLISSFNSKIAICQAPSKNQILALESTVHPYRSNLGIPSCSVGGGNKSWAGLFSKELNKAEPLKAAYWAGIDCSHLVMRTTEASTSGMSGTISPLSAWRTSCQLFYSNSVCQAHNNSKIPLHITDAPSGFTYNFGEGDNKTTIPTAKIHKGDLVSYDGHVAITYSNRSTCDDDGEDCLYDIVHAYGSNSYQPLTDAGKPVGKPVFSRKVIRTKNNISAEPIGFGRITIWK